MCAADTFLTYFLLLFFILSNRIVIFYCTLVIFSVRKVENFDKLTVRQDG